MERVCRPRLHGQILIAWIVKEELRALCALAAHGGDPIEIRRRLWTFYSWCADAAILELTTPETIETVAGCGGRSCSARCGRCVL